MSESGRLKVEEVLSGVAIQVPGEQHLIAAIYWSMYALLSVGGLVMVLSGSVSLETVVSIGGALTVLGGFAGAGWMVFSVIIQRMQAPGWPGSCCSASSSSRPSRAQHRW
ncbi:MAG: hypothetical protein ACI8RZ_007131 [Myxococcota bacterium]|jgi:hypothetical protein